MDKLSHKDRKVVSLIDVPLWDEAKWRAVGYICVEGRVPILALSFKNPEAANKIFEEWRDILGEVDEQNKLRIAIITGVSKKNPLNYKVLITTNPEKIDFDNFNHYVFTARFMEMSPETPKNLNYFLHDYKKAGRFTLVPAQINAEQNYPEPTGKLWLGKYDLVVRPAWQIGLNDPDIFVIQQGDDPIIPEGVTNAPVLRALQRFDKRKSRKRHK